ncbi:hypothetical protein [Salinibacillus xinjiangensis]|uniref:EamA domain-containing protein n=1 Tax=Salinibacillus xinjiangensis TaxID=1229268 RepID=A0A6G1X868_9BACI|nr:hypothetical protein [Salinibacillus xinjiangensis]MRG87070.1 hypothetical protein [Salinibacillus xinjiangensis]
MWFIFLMLLGFGMTTAGGVSLIIYLNIIPVGVSFYQYLIFVKDRPECYLFILGIVIIVLTVYFARER